MYRVRKLTEGLPQPPKWGVVVAVWMLAACGGVYQLAPASINVVVMDRLGIGHTASGFIISVTFLAIAVGSIPVGIAQDRTDTRRAIIAAAGLFCVANVGAWLAAAAGNYWALILARVVASVGYVALWNGGATVVGNAFDSGWRATALGIYTASAPVGFVIAQISSPLVAAAFDWSLVFASASVAIVPGLVLFTLSSRDHSFPDDDGETPSVSDFGDVLTDRRVLLLGVLGFMAYSVYVFFNSWIPSFLSESYTLSLTQSGLLAAMYPAIGIFSRSSGGVFSDRYLGQRRRPVVLAAFAVSAPMTVLVFLVDSLAGVVLFLLVGGFFIQMGIGILYTHVREVVDAGVATTAVAVLTSIGVFGSFSGPVVTGALIGTTGAYVAAFGYTTLLGALGAVLALWAPEPDR